MLHDNSLLYFQLTRFGHCYGLDLEYNPKKFLASIDAFQDQWKPYNPRKPIPRQGLSITSLDGELSGIPDLDSLQEWNKERGTRLTELDIKVPTPVFEHAEPYIGNLKPWIRRSHVIRLNPGGYFPTHRDNRKINIDCFRLFVPLENCNSPKMYFMLEDRVINFQHGRVYFIDTCLEHALFNVSNSDSVFIVLNLALTATSVDAVCRHLHII
jgi:hypothetical protein